ncbi:MAG: alpha/beta hydrolase fold domain-containing protein [Acidobacteria bacterium]|nr:alpha/beta hydrolase fold domain-containing protein [Acidobacteriota bacterium]
MTDKFAAKTARTIEPENDPRLSRETKKFLRALNSPVPPELEKLTPVEARKVLSDAQAAFEFDYSGIEESEKTIQSDGYEIRLNRVRPAGVAGILPVFIFIHGGGWVPGDYPTHRRMVRDLTIESGAAAFFVNYTPTPDAVYPQQIDEIYAALRWVAENGGEIGVDGKIWRSYGRKLDEAGVPVTVARYDGMIHDFGLLNGLAHLPPVKSLFVQAGAELRRHLGR